MFKLPHPYHVLIVTIGLSLFSVSLSAQAGWQTFKDRTGDCQLSVPANWSVLSEPGHAGSPEHMGTTVIEGRVAFHPFHFSDGMLKVMNVETVFENSAQRVFYSANSGATPPSLIYHVEVPGRTKVCIAEISSTPSYPQDEVKKIAATLAAVR
jgi:hypothetical protein